MATIADLIVRISGNSKGLQKELAAAQRQIKSALGSEAIALSEKAQTALLAVGASVAAAGIAAVKMAGDMQASEKAFGTLLKDTQKAKEFVSDLRTFAAETPFELKGLQDTSKKLLAFGFAAQDIIPIMATIGDASAMLGRGQEGIDRMTLAIAQMQAKGRAQGEELLQLSEVGVNAYKYLAESMGISIAEVMDKVSKGEVDSTQAINAILLGMQKDFKGGMEGLSKEIPGLFSTIKDNALQILAGMGKEITESLDIKGVMQSLADELGEFAAYVNKFGINQALRDLIPPELTSSVIMLAGAIGGAAVGAMVLFGTATWAAIAPLVPFMAAGAAIAALAWVLWQGWQPISTLFPAVWEKACAATASAWNQIQTLTLSGVKNVLNLIKPIADIFGGSMKSAVDGWLQGVGSSLKDLSAEALTLDKNNKKATDTLKKSWKTTADLISNKAENIAKNLADATSGKNLNKDFTGLSNTPATNGGAGANAGKKAASQAAKELKKLENEAKRVSKSIEQEWVQTTKTELEQLDLWKTEQFAALEKTAAANENCERDKERVAAVYSTRRRKIIAREADEAQQQAWRIRDAYESITQEIALGFARGKEKDLLQFDFDHEGTIKDLQRTFADIAKEYATANDAQKANMLKALEEQNIEYKLLGEDRLDFAKEIADKEAAYRKMKLDETTRYYAQCKDIQADIDEAYEYTSMSMLQEALTRENAVRMSKYEAQKQMMDLYQQAMLDSALTTQTLMASIYEEGYSSLKSVISDVLMGAQSVNEAIMSLSKSILQVVADMIAQYVAGMLMASIMGGNQMQKHTAESVAAGAATAAAWAPAAAMVSLASFGENAAPAMMGIIATTALASTSGLLGLANGGITTGPTIAEIGEGRYKEAVLPLSRKHFEKAGLIGQSKSVVVNMTVNTPDANSFRASERQIMRSLRRA